MKTFLRLGLDAVLAVIAAVGSATLPHPKPVPVRVVAGKRRR